MIEWFAQAWDGLILWIFTIWNSFIEFMTELPLIILGGFLSAIALLIESIPVPSFLEYGLQSLLYAVDPTVLYFLTQSGFGAAMAVLGAGFGFRMLRKLFTLGQW